MTPLFLPFQKISLIKRTPIKNTHSYSKTKILCQHNQNNKNSNEAKPNFIHIPSLNPMQSIIDYKNSIYDKVYPLTIQVTEPMYRVMLYDNGLNCILKPERLISMAIPSIKRARALKIIENARKYTNTVIVTVPLNEGIKYLKQLKMYSFTITLTEA